MATPRVTQKFIPPPERIVRTPGGSKAKEIWNESSKSISKNWELLFGGEYYVGRVFALNFLNSFTYMPFALLLPVIATNEYGFSDEEAGTIYGVWGLFVTLWAILGSFAIDKLGVRKCATLALIWGTFSHGLIVFTRSRNLLYLALYVLCPLGDGMVGPTISVALKRNTNPEIRPLAFGISYAIMNLASAFGYSLIDLIRQHEFEIFGLVFTGQRTVLLVTWLALMPAAGVAFFLKDGETEEADISMGKAADQTAHGFMGRMWHSIRAFFMDLKNLCQDARFHRVVVFVVAVLFVSQQFRLTGLLIPKYLTRVHGEDVPYGSIQSINPWFCVVLPPIIAALTVKMDDYKVILPGVTLMACAPIVLIFSNSLVAAASWVALLSLGEVAWSPRAVSFIASQAPAGREAVFLAFSMWPTYLVKLPAGWFSGYLLKSYCPNCPSCQDSSGNFCKSLEYFGDGFSCFSRGERCELTETGSIADGICPSTCVSCPGWAGNPQMIWVWILGMSVISPILLLLLRKHIVTPSPPDAYTSTCEDLSPEELELSAKRAERRRSYGSMDIVEDQNNPLLG